MILKKRVINYHILSGRDTASLDETSIVRAVIETVAENMSDGIIAPILFAGLGGAPLAMAYKAVNTCDSMFGYKNEKYLEFGFVSAKMDDLFNYIPARLTGYLIIIASFILGLGLINKVIRFISVIVIIIPVQIAHIQKLQ